MESVENQQYVFLGIKVKPGPMERHKVENFALDNTVDQLKSEAEKKTNVPSASLELIHHGKILKDNATLFDSGVKSGEMVHVVKKKMQAPPAPPPTYTDAELQLLNSSLRTLGCTPNAPGWTRAMQLLNDESAMDEIIDHAPSLVEDCMTLSILHEVELLAALGANLQTMRRGAEAHPDLPNALRHLMRLVRSRSTANTSESAPTSGFAYSLEALSEDEDGEEEETEDGETRNAITPEQFAAALQSESLTLAPSIMFVHKAELFNVSRGLKCWQICLHVRRHLAMECYKSATEAALTSGRRSGAPDGLLRLLQAATSPMGSSAAAPSGGTTSGTSVGSTRGAITAEMFSEAISEALNRANPAGTPMDQSTAASSSQSPVARDEEFSTQLQHMHEMGLMDDTLNMRALRICAGDVNAAINLVFSGAIGDD